MASSSIESPNWDADADADYLNREYCYKLDEKSEILLIRLLSCLRDLYPQLPHPNSRSLLYQIVEKSGYINSVIKNFGKNFFACVRFRQILESSVKIILSLENPDLYHASAKKLSLFKSIDLLAPNAVWPQTKSKSNTPVRSTEYLALVLSEETIPQLHNLRRTLNSIVHPHDDKLEMPDYTSLTESQLYTSCPEDIAQRSLSQIIQILFMLASYLTLFTQPHLKQGSIELPSPSEHDRHMREALSIFLDHKILIPPSLNSTQRSLSIKVYGSTKRVKAYQSKFPKPVPKTQHPPQPKPKRRTSRK